MTKTIKELYDLGQRQFPMRGGGVSPILEYNDSFKCLLFKHDESDGIYFTDEGKAAIEESWLPSMDLLPIPLPDYKAMYEALKKACEPIVETANDIDATSPDMSLYLKNKTYGHHLDYADCDEIRKLCAIIQAIGDSDEVKS